MVGTCLEVKPFDGVGEFSIWLGTHLERQNLVKSKATKQPKTKRPSKKKPIVDRDQQPQPKRLKHASGLARPLLANLEARPVDDASHDDSDDDVVTRAFLQDGSSGSDVGNHSMDLELELEEEQGQEEEEERKLSHMKMLSHRGLIFYQNLKSVARSKVKRIPLTKMIAIQSPTKPLMTC